MNVLLVFILIALAIGLCIEQSLRIHDEYILQRQIDKLRERIERMEHDKTD